MIAGQTEFETDESLSSDTEIALDGLDRDIFCSNRLNSNCNSQLWSCLVVQKMVVKSWRVNAPFHSGVSLSTATWDVTGDPCKPNSKKLDWDRSHGVVILLNGGIWKFAFDIPTFEQYWLPGPISGPILLEANSRPWIDGQPLVTTNTKCLTVTFHCHEVRHRPYRRIGTGNNIPQFYPRNCFRDAFSLVSRQH